MCAGRNSAFDHAGNIFLAAAAGVTGWLLGQRAVFLLGPVFAAFAAWAVLSIPAKDIDHDRARGAAMIALIALASAFPETVNSVGADA